MRHDTAGFIAAMERPDDDPDHLFRALERLVRDTVGAKLFTLMTFDRDAADSERVYSNMPDAYPVSGRKPISPDVWTETVLERGQTFVAQDIDAIAGVFPDHELIASLGCESCMNLPVIVEGEVIGTLNCLDVAGHYTPDRVAAAESLKLPGAVALLAHAARSDRRTA